jgi:phosphoglycolate phosphatase
MPPGDLIIFDFDGTLADTWRDIATAVNQTLVGAELPPVEAASVKDWIGHGVLNLLRRALTATAGTADERRVAALYDVFRGHYDRCCLDTTTLYDGMRAALDQLDGATLAILSNKPQFFLDRIVDGLGVRRRFVAVVGGDALAVQKPDPATIAHVVALAGPAARIWMVGDSAVDVATGRAYAAHTVGCTWGMRPRAELQEAGAAILIDHPAELPAAIAS